MDVAEALETLRILLRFPLFGFPFVVIVLLVVTGVVRALCWLFAWVRQRL